VNYNEFVTFISVFTSGYGKATLMLLATEVASSYDNSRTGNNLMHCLQLLQNAAIHLVLTSQ